MENLGNIYFVWGADDSPYGPVDLSVLLDWIEDDRVVPDTRIFSRDVGNWVSASELPELKSPLMLKLAAMSGIPAPLLAMPIAAPRPSVTLS